jgi:amino acid adenylation domain-containing protein
VPTGDEFREGIMTSKAFDLPLSSAQLGIWHAINAGVPASDYNISEYISISGAIDPALFEVAVRHVVAETEAICVRVVRRDNLPWQLPGPPPDWYMTYQDVSSAADPVSVAVDWMRREMTQPLDLLVGPLFAFALFKTGPERFLWYVRYHHIVMDAFGGALIARRVADVYSTLASGSPVDCKPFGSLAALLAEDAAYRASGHFSADRQYWQDVMAECPEPVNLGVPMSPASGQFLRQTVEVPSETAAQLQHLARTMDLTFPQIITLCTVIFIHRLTEAEDIVLGQLMTARMSRLSRQMPAMMTNVVPLRVQIDPDMRVEDLGVVVRRSIRAGMRHQRYRIADLRRDLRRIGRPMFRQLISVRPFDYDARFAGFRGTTCPLSGPVEELNIHVDYDQSDDAAWRVEFDANPAFYDRELLTRLQRRFIRLMTTLRDPAELVGRLDILPDDERRQIVIGWNNTASSYPRDQHLHELFEEQARRTPDRVAVVFEQQQLTYRDLNEQSDRLCHRLTLLGVGAGDRVGLYVERSLGMVVGLLAILKAGAAYVPLDPSYPQDRLAFIFEDSQPVVLLTQQSLQDRLRPRNAAVLCLDTVPVPPTAATRARSSGRAPEADLAYVLYTSGSTGRPKGVEIPHRALVNFLKAMQHNPGITREDRLLSVTSLSFDIAGLELFLPLVVGAQVTIAPSEVASDGFRLAALMEASHTTIMQATPATWRLLLKAGWRGSPDLKILCGGEAWPADLAGALLPCCASLWNMYGPTETTVWSSAARVEDDQRVLLGPPIANTTFYVLDRNSQPVPIGVPGELYIGGDGVARGYLNRPELTSERFVPDPYSKDPAARLYRTGDCVRYLPDGRLEFLSRLDHQVKIRGFRIELGEIESVLRTHPEIQDAVVLARDCGDGEKRLVAYITARHSERVPAGDLRDLLQRKLPPYMIPSAFIPLDAFPLTPNGKIDRGVLPLPDEQMPRDIGKAHVAPRTPLETLLAGFCRTHLRLQQVGVHDNFFDMGGDSLSMLGLSLDIEQATSKHFPLSWIYDAPTVAGIAEAILGQRAVSSYSPLVLLRPGTQAPPVFMVHPVGGSTIRLIPIAKLLPGHHPIYGIQAKGLDGTDAPIDRVEAMADCYVNAITEVQPHGPYLLAGMCFGGLIALEIARRLSERGEQIGLLALLDAYPHPRYWPQRFRLDYLVVRRVRTVLSTLRTEGLQKAAPYITTKLMALLRKSTARMTGRQSLPEAPEYLPPAVKAVLQGGLAALENYQPRYYRGKANYLMCGYHDYLPEAPRSVWKGLIGQLEIDSAPVMMSPEYVANWLYDRIQDVIRHDMVFPVASRDTVDIGRDTAVLLPSPRNLCCVLGNFAPPSCHSTPDVPAAL